MDLDVHGAAALPLDHLHLAIVHDQRDVSTSRPPGLTDLLDTCFRTCILIHVPRPSKFPDERILAATSRLAAIHGPAGATIGAIARSVGAPTGSIYHRFASRDVLLATVWLRAAAAFQDAVFARLAGAVPRDAGLEAALYMARRVREEPQEARLLLVHRREDFVDRGWPAAFRRQAARLAQQIDTELRAFSRRLCGREDAGTVRMVTYAVIEAPFAAIRRHVAARERPPPCVDLLIQVTYAAVMELLSRGDRS
jgi:AcrR family transcriptional regulator